MSVEAPVAVGDDAITALRRARRSRRLGDTEWYDVAYRVYLFALAGLVATVLASDAIAGVIDDDVTTDQLVTRGPALAGVAVVAAFGVGLRAGADGGPVSIEAADVRHLLVAPISRTRALLGPIVQRFRATAFIAALACAVVAQLIAREVEGSRAAWAASGARYGARVAMLYVSSALGAHATRLVPWHASVVAAATFVWQTVAVWSVWNDAEPAALRAGPGNLIGSVALWGIRQRGIDIVAVVVVFVLVGVSCALGARLRPDDLERRARLVSQLRFAATVQDLRTVVALRRQLRSETLRRRAIFGAAAPDAAPRSLAADGSARPRPGGAGRVAATLVWRRCAASTGRLPVSRFVRIAALAATAGAAASLAVTWPPLLCSVVTVAGFLCGLEALESLSQEVDRPDRTEALPVERGWLFTHHLVVPAALIAVAGVVAAIAAAIVEPGHTTAAFVLGIPLMWAAAIGAVVSTVSAAPAAPDVAATSLLASPRSDQPAFEFPEFAGGATVVRAAVQFLASGAPEVALLALRAEPTGGVVVRSALGMTL